MLTIYTIVFNEELMLPHFIRHYRKNFPGCRIIVYDNHSTDATVRIAYSAGCEVIPYDTNNQLDDMKYLEIKNHCWQGQKERWALIADCDELCQIDRPSLYYEESMNHTVISFQGYNMVNHENSTNVPEIFKAVKDEMYSKSYLFDTTKIKEINYSPGCHVSKPVGDVLKSKNIYSCYHYKYINADLMVSRYRRNAQRMAAYGRSKGMGSHYWKGESAIRSEFESMQKISVPIRIPMDAEGLKIFVTYFDEPQVNKIPPALHLSKVNLTTLPVGEFQDNRLSEHRLFISEKLKDEKCPYVGFMTWRWFQKNKFMIPLEQLWQLYRSPEIVWAAWPDKNWYRKSCIDHPGIKKYLDELIELTGFESDGTGLLANQFICSIDVYRDFEVWFRKYFYLFHTKYGYNYDFFVKDNYMNRQPAVFYERFAALYFANRKDLIIKQIPNR